MLGAKWDWFRFETWQPYLASLPSGATYYEVVWCDIEPSEGSPDWEKTDSVIRRSRALGFTTLVKIRVGRCWATGGSARYLRGKKSKTESAMPRDLSRYADFVHEVVARYSGYGVTEYAVENEVNSPSFWLGTPQDYRELVSVAATAIHQGDPTAQVVDSGVSSVASGYAVVDRLLRSGSAQAALDAYNSYFARRIGTRGALIPEVGDEAGLEDVLTSAQGTRNIAYGELTNQLVTDHLVDVRQLHFYEQWSALPYLLDYVEANTPAATPVEMWEVGSFLRDSTLSPIERRAELIKVVSLALRGGVTKLVWLPLGDNPDGRVVAGQFASLLDSDGRESLSAKVFAAMNIASGGARIVGIDEHGLAGVGFERAGQSTTFVWSSGSNGKTLSVPAGTQLETSTGAPRTLATPTGVRVGSFPQQITVPGTVEHLLSAQS